MARKTHTPIAATTKTLEHVRGLQGLDFWPTAPGQMAFGDGTPEERASATVMFQLVGFPKSYHNS